MDSMKAREEENGLDQKIEEAWADGGVDPVVLPAGDVSKRLLIQRTFLGASWLLMLPVFIWLMWPWIERAVGGTGPRNEQLRAIERRLEDVRIDAEALRLKADSRGRSLLQALESEEEALTERLALLSKKSEDTELRIAVGAIGLAIWVVMIGLAIRSGVVRPAQNS